MKDQDLDLLLAEYRSQRPSEIQIQKWKQTVRQERIVMAAPKKSVRLQLVAATVVGFIVGALVFKTNKTEDLFQKAAELDGGDATIEYVYIKSN